MKKLSKNNAFTLLEVVIVIIIIGVLASLALPHLQTAINRSYAAEAVTMMSSMRAGIERYYLMNDYDPMAYRALDCNYDGTCDDGSTLDDLINFDNPTYTPGSHFMYVFVGQVPEGSYAVEAC